MISNQRPNSAVEYQHTEDSKKATIAFDDDGVCDACRVAEQKQATIDWEQREDQLAALCDQLPQQRRATTASCRAPAARTASTPSHVLKTRTACTR